MSSHHRTPPGEHARQVARHLISLREQRGWTRGQLAHALTRTPAPLTADAIARIEAGITHAEPMRNVTLDEFMALAQALGVQPAELLDDPGSPDCQDGPPRGPACPGCGGHP